MRSRNENWNVSEWDLEIIIVNRLKADHEILEDILRTGSINKFIVFLPPPQKKVSVNEFKEIMLWRLFAKVFVAWSRQSIRICYPGNVFIMFS